MIKANILSIAFFIIALCGYTVIYSQTGIVANGGTITYANGRTIHTFTGSGTFTVICGSDNIEVLIVAGGGGGGGSYQSPGGGGGGGGGVIYNTAFAASPGSYAVTVGAGGIGGTGNASGSVAATNGSNSVFGSLTAFGGGNGGQYDGGVVAGSGGSGGGGVSCPVGGGTGTVGQGNNGGTTISNCAPGNTQNAAGGGGAGAMGNPDNLSAAGDGGAGLAVSISGTSVFYGGGGGGGAGYNVYNGSVGGAGGIGGGGAGWTSIGGPGNGTAGVANTGGGGGGAGTKCSSGCQTSQTGGDGGSGIVIISYPTTSPVTVTVNSATICAGQSAILIADGGTTYSWSTGETTDSIAVSPVDTVSYTVIGITDGCADTATAIVTVNQLPVISVNDTTICSGAATTLIASGGTGYSWSTGETTTSIIVSPVIPTTYTVVGTTNGCSDSAVASITITQLPSITVNYETICIGQTTVLRANGGTAYIWSTGETTDSITVSPVVPTTYTVVGTTNSCSDSAIASVTVNPLPIITVNSETICAGQTAVLTATEGTTYVWSTGATTDSIAVSPTDTTSYTVIGTSTDGCADTVTALVVVKPLPVITVNDATICNGATANLIASGGTGYNWSTGATTDSIVVSPVVPTTYTVIGITNGCSDSAVASVNVTTLPVITLNPEAICIGQSAVLTADGGTTYSWSTGATTDSITVSPVIPTTYTVTGTTNGCSDSAVASVTINPLPTLTKTAVNPACNGVCTGQTVVIPSGGTAPYSYSWSSGCTSTICTGLCPGSYTVIVTDAFGCSAEADTLITEPTALTAAITNYTLTSCVDSCDAIATLLASGGTPGTGYTYSWNTSPQQTTDTAINLCSGTYTCTVTDANNCTNTATVVINEPAPVVLVVNTTPTACASNTGTAVVIASGGAGGYTYSWSASSQTTSTVTGLTNGNYTVTVTDMNGCPAVQIATINTVDNPVAIASATLYTISEGNSTQLNATGGSNFQWSPVTGLSCDTCQATTASPLLTTEYCITVTDTNACTDSSCVTIIVEKPCPADYKVPNAFSPNNDGFNDKLCLQGWSNCVSEFSILIFDRWGEKIYESNNPAFCWDGSYKSAFGAGADMNMNAAVFVYVLEATLSDGTEISRKGNISLVR